MKLSVGYAVYKQADLRVNLKGHIGGTYNQETKCTDIEIKYLKSAHYENEAKHFSIDLYILENSYGVTHLFAMDPITNRIQDMYDIDAKYAKMASFIIKHVNDLDNYNYIANVKELSEKEVLEVISNM